MKTILINPKDNAAVAAETLRRGETVEINGSSLTLLTDIPAGHKTAVRDIRAGENIIKYGFPIGHAKAEIKAGEHSPAAVGCPMKSGRVALNAYARLFCNGVEYLHFVHTAIYAARAQNLTTS